MSVLGNRSFSIVRTEACHHSCSGSNCYHLRSARSELALSWECLWNLRTTQPLDTLVWTLVHSPLHYSDSLYTALLGLWSTSNSASSLVLLHCMWSLGSLCQWLKKVSDYISSSRMPYLFLPQCSPIFTYTRRVFSSWRFHLPPHQVTPQNFLPPWFLFFSYLTSHWRLIGTAHLHLPCFVLLFNSSIKFIDDNI